MSKPYAPPYSLTTTIVHRVAQICEALGRFAVALDASALRLRRINRIHTIQGSLAIEGNTLDVVQITAILDGKRVLAPPRQIQEVRNAIKAYDRLLPILESLEPELKAVQPPWRADNEANLLEAHATLMTGLQDAPGQYRDGGVGVMAGTQIIHMAPPASRVPHLMQDLLAWLKTTKEHPLILSAVFHYEFEFIHPFSDGNGRMGRLWQSLILSQWQSVFAQIPVESLIFEHQQAYYDAIQRSTQNADCAVFIEFMLDMIAQALPTAAPQVSPQVTPQVVELVHVLVGEMARDELQLTLGLRDRKSFVARYLKPALAAGLVEYTRPEQPTSRLQKYRLSNAGHRMAGKR